MPKLGREYLQDLQYFGNGYCLIGGVALPCLRFSPKRYSNDCAFKAPVSMLHNRLKSRHVISYSGLPRIDHKVIHGPARGPFEIKV